ncbi:hypothetical protein ACS91_00470 [Vibrio parahaemolyticus]|uniref:hypothetical protein n=1 Tax=Vibrio parahaemolyticus TaxID=670 RepID=UPI0006C3CCB6|nr:hypothetical protein ACS91_00470 [Vibrio parahaemolyticus]
MTEENKELLHKHFRMGRGKYRLISIWSAPSKAVLESNPMGYNKMMAERPKYCNMVCDHCGFLDAVAASYILSIKGRLHPLLSEVCSASLQMPAKHVNT